MVPSAVQQDDMTEQFSTERNPFERGPGLDECIPVARPAVFESTRAASPPMHLNELSRKSAWVDIFTLIFVVLSMEALAGAALAVLNPDRPSSGENRHDLLIPGLILRVVVCLTVVGLILRARNQTPASIGLQWRGAGWDMLLGLPTLAVTAGIMFLVMTTVTLTFPGAMKQAMENADRLTRLIPRMSVAGYALLMGTVGFYEEVVFRGFLMPRLRRCLGSWIAAVPVSTVIFTLPHAIDQTGLALLPVAILSLSFSVITIARQSILPAVAAHALYNLGVIVFLHRIAAQEG
jgi:membrane protease YdiL (CAAX protease family)